MPIERVRELYKAQPFQPFVMHLADSREITVPHPEFMALSRSERTIAVSHAEGTFEIIDLLPVVSVEFVGERVA